MIPIMLIRASVTTITVVASDRLMRLERWRCRMLTGLVFRPLTGLEGWHEIPVASTAPSSLEAAVLFWTLKGATKADREPTTRLEQAKSTRRLQPQKKKPPEGGQGSHAGRITSSRILITELASCQVGLEMQASDS